MQPVPSNVQQIKRLWGHVALRRRRQFAAFVALTIVSAFAEMVSFGALIPFIGVITSPDSAMHAPVVARIARFLDLEGPDALGDFITVAFVAIAALAATLRMILLWASTRLTTGVGTDLSVEVYRRSLYQPYAEHLARNSSEIIGGIVHHVWGAAYGTVAPIQALIVSLITVVSVLGALFLVNPGIAAVTTLGLGGCYVAVTLLARLRLSSNSRVIATEQIHVLRALQEGLGGIRDVLLSGTQAAYCAAFRRADLPLRRALGNNILIAQSPRFVIEALGVISIACLARTLSRRPGGVVEALPVLAALALAAQRILPALQGGYHAWASITGNQECLAATLKLLETPLPPVPAEPSPPPLHFQRAIRFENVRFRYANDAPWVLDGLDLNVPRRARVGFVGPTGGGKSTALDLLMGLLEPTEGRMLVDDEPTHGTRLRAWQQSISHVPQAIFLTDATILENIALGVELRDIDVERARHAARHAQIADFIEGTRLGYRTLVGERGVRLSGGQRQRVGIARALYRQSSVLVLDEATSALDSATERAVMDALDRLDADLTVLIVAHRLTTVERCDTIVELSGGRARVRQRGEYFGAARSHGA